MENKLNLVEILKYCPKGMELDCTMVDDVTFYGIGNEETIVVKRELVNLKLYLDRYGAPVVFPKEDLKCVIFPKGKTSWEGFVPPCEFKDGDIAISNRGDIHLLRTKDSSYCAYRERWNGLPKFDKAITTSVRVVRLATEEEKAKLFDAIKANGYKWNAKTKTLEKLIEPKFKVGDKVKRKDVNYTYIITIAKLGGDYYDYVNEDGQCGVIHISKQDDWELVPNKFDISTLKPFDKVLARDNDSQKWDAELFSFYNNESEDYHFQLVGVCSARYCIPYEENKHLLGTSNDCDEYFKTWE